MTAIIILAVCAIAAALIENRAGHWIVGLLLGLFLGPIGVLVAIFDAFVYYPRRARRQARQVPPAEQPLS